MKEEKDLRKSEHIQMDDYCNRSFYSRYCVSLLDDTNVYKCKRVSLRNSFDQLTDCFERRLFHGQYVMYGPKCKKKYSQTKGFTQDEIDSLWLYLGDRCQLIWSLLNYAR